MEAQLQGRFWPFHDLLFAERHDFSREDLLDAATRLRLDLPRFREALDSGRHISRVRQDTVAGHALGLRAVPAMFFNGRFVSGAKPIAEYERILVEELARADALLARGVAREALHRTVD